MAGESRRLLRPRVILYPALLAVVLVIFLSLLGTRPDADVTILRNVGVPFVRLPDGRIGNTLKLKITNRTEAPASYVVEPVGGADVELRVPEELADLRPGETRTVGILAAAGQGVFHAGHHTLTLRVRDQRDFRAEFSIQLLGPSVEAP